MRVLILETDHVLYRKLLENLPIEIDIVATDDLMAARGLADGCQFWLGAPDLTAALLKQVAPPSFIQSSWSGIAPLLAADLPRSYRLARAVGVFGQFIGEFILMCMLAHERQLLQRAVGQAVQRWENGRAGSLAGRHLLMVGCGDIGVAVGGLLEPFGMRLSGIARTGREIAPFGHVQGLDRLGEAVLGVDYVINLLPDTSETRDVYNANVFSAFKKSAVFINVGRGTAVVDGDLVAALNSGDLAAAFLDVCREEPLPAGHAFWKTDNLVLTNHTAGMSAPEGVTALFAENVVRYKDGRALRGEIDFAAEY